MLIKKYNTKWPLDFDEIKQVLISNITSVPFKIEHVGSTSVPFLDAKPIIDIDIIYFQKVDFETIKSGLEKLGYYHNGDQGILDREVFKRNLNAHHEILDTIVHHLYVCPQGSKALERHLLSRNFLRNHEWARLKYQEMKYELAEKANQNKKLYAELKELIINQFIDSMIEDKFNPQYSSKLRCESINCNKSGN